MDAATKEWMATVTRSDDSSAATTALYAPDAVLWGTVSEDVRVGGFGHRPRPRRRRRHRRSRR